MKFYIHDQHAASKSYNTLSLLASVDFIHVILPSHTIPTIRELDVSDPALTNSSIQSFMQLPIFTSSSLLLQRGDLHSSTYKSGSRYVISL